MPNWVYNYLDVEGNPAEVADLKQQLARPFTLAIENQNMGDINPHGYPTKIKQVTYSNPVFAFHNIYNYKDAGITDEEYACQPARTGIDVSDPNWWAESEKLRLVDKSWYSWNITNWGVKWDVAVSDDDKYPETEMYADSPDTLGYKFNTAWGIPDEAITKLSEQYPTINFTLSYEEETGWGGERTYLNGQVTDVSEYGWKCRECEHEEEETPYCDTCEFDMCPQCGYGEPMDEDREQCELHKEGAVV